jgi:beta-galactosidase/beta-glucuronidase
MMKYLRYTFVFLLPGLLMACSHKFDSQVLDLNFYQWNLWPDEEAASLDDEPSCGWEELHRGVGKLVRIPALITDHFPQEDGIRVFWYHCRFTLPEDWEEKEVSLRFFGVGPTANVYLNGELIGSNRGAEGNFDLDVTKTIYYTRDNHLAIQISDTKADSSQSKGISGTVQARVKTSP